MARKRSVSVRAEELVRFVKELKGGGADFVTAHNAINSQGGKMSELFPDDAEKAKFRETPECNEMWSVLDTFPPPGHVDVKGPADMSGKFIVRLPRSLHAALAVEAEGEGVSLNQLVLSKLASRLRQPV